MRLINTRTLELEEFYGERVPKRYAILSHTWENEEVTFQDWQDINVASRKAGFEKIKGARDQALRHDLDYLWVDTNCIDKTSSAELSEAINSMFTWYHNAAICYAYLIDVPPLPKQRIAGETQQHIYGSRWFTRGWTLQELLAPPHLIFFAKDWSKIGTRSTLADKISAITQIDTSYLTGDQPLTHASVAKKMSWLSCRVTTRVEDMAYCVLGIFDINMPLLYGEGSKSFIRLQEEIIKISNDHTVFLLDVDQVDSTRLGQYARSVSRSVQAFRQLCPDKVQLGKQEELRHDECRSLYHPSASSGLVVLSCRPERRA